MNRHEAGHNVAARTAGARITACKVGAGGGVAHVQLPRGASPIDDAIIDFAGWYAAGTWSGCGSDVAHARRALRGLPGGERAARGT